MARLRSQSHDWTQRIGGNGGAPRQIVGRGESDYAAERCFSGSGSELSLVQREAVPEA